MQAIYSYDNLRIILFYVIIPLTVLLLIYLLFSKIYEMLRKNKDENYTSYVLNYWGITIGILFCAVLLSVSVGFSLAFIKTVQDLNAIDSNIYLYYFFMVFPVFPFIFLIVYIRKFLRNMKNRELLEKGE